MRLLPAKQDAGMHLDIKHKRIHSAARELLAEKKIVSVDQIYEKMQSSGLQVSAREIEQCLTNLFQLAGSVQPVTLFQALLFSTGALGYWNRGYAILVVKKPEHLLLYGVSCATPDTGNLIGKSSDTTTANGFLRGSGIVVEEWYPFGEYLRLLP